jgi:hypothetical protein
MARDALGGERSDGRDWRGRGEAAGIDEGEERRRGSARVRSGGGDASCVRGATRGQEPSVE